MSKKTTAASQLRNLSRILAQPSRWIILRELAKGQALPVSEIARRAECTPAMGTHHLAMLKDAGLVISVYGRLYALTPSLLPLPGATTLDLGPCLIKLAPAEPPAPATA